MSVLQTSVNNTSVDLFISLLLRLREEDKKRKKESDTESRKKKIEDMPEKTEREGKRAT